MGEGVAVATAAFDEEVLGEMVAIGESVPMGEGFRQIMILP